MFFFYIFISDPFLKTAKRCSLPLSVFLYFSLSLIPCFCLRLLMEKRKRKNREAARSRRFYCWLAATSGGCVVPGRAVMETFGEAEQGRLMLSVMCVWTAIYFFYIFSQEALGPVPPAPNVFPLLNSWPQSGAKKDRRERGNWERERGEKKQMWFIWGVKMDLNWWGGGGYRRNYSRLSQRETVK